MKKFLSLFLVFGLLLCTAMQAQTHTFLNVNGDEKLGKSLTTTDSAYHYIDILNIGTNEGGVIEVAVVGYATDTAYSLTGIKKVRFNKRRGTLTLGTVADEQAAVVDAALGTATFDIVAVSNNIYIRIKGKDGLSIKWYSTVKRKSVKYS